MARVPVFHAIKVIVSDLQNCCSKESYPLCHAASFYPLLISFRLQIVYKNVKNLRIGGYKVVGKVLINLSHHAKFFTSRKISRLCNQHNY